VVIPGAGAEEFAAAVPFGDLRLLVFGDDTLHLSEQPCLRVVGVEVGGVGETDGHPESGQLVEDQHLVGVGTSQPVRRQAVDRLEQPSLGGVAQGVEPGPVQPGAGQSVVRPRFGDGYTDIVTGYSVASAATELGVRRRRETSRRSARSRWLSATRLLAG
jgi:hypothetical protein